MSKSVSIGIGSVLFLGGYFRYYLWDKYGPQPLELHPVGSVYEWNGRKVKTIGYTGHAQHTIKNMDYNRYLWFAEETATAVNYAILNGTRKGHVGQVAEVVIDAEKKLKSWHFDIKPYLLIPKHYPMTKEGMRELNVKVRSDNAVTIDPFAHKHGIASDFRRFMQ